MISLPQATALGLAVAILAACSNGDGDADGADDTTASTTDATASTNDATTATTEPADDEPAFAGSRLLVLEDADTLASAYVDDQIGPDTGAVDRLGVVDLASGLTDPTVSFGEVSTSVWGPPLVLDVRPDGSTAYVLEVKEPRQDGDSSFEIDLPYTTNVSVVDLTGDAPRTLETVETPGFAAQSLDLSPTGDLLAIANWQGPVPDNPDVPPGQITIVPVEDGTLGDGQQFALAGVDGDFASPNTIAWSPDGRHLALTVGPRNVVAFYEVTGVGGELSVEPVGEPVEVGQFPFTGLWTPDGTRFLTGNVQWDLVADVNDTNAPSGSVSVVTFDEDGEHQIAETGGVGVNPEGLAISPEGTRVVTVNLWYSHLPDAAEATQSSISVLSLDPDSGTLTMQAEVPFEGVLPEGVVFDTAGEQVAVAVFDEPGQTGAGSIRIFDVDDETIVDTGVSIPTGRGAHTLRLIP